MSQQDRDPRWADRRFKFQRHRTWSSLSRTLDPRVRRCDECRREVYLCADENEAVMHAQQHRCVAVPARPARRTGPLPLLLPRAPGTPMFTTLGMFDADRAPTIYWLVPLDGPQAGQTLRLPRAPFTLGRGPADVVIADASLAPAQLVFEDLGGGLDAYDARLPAGPERRASALGLYDGVRFTVGQTRLVFKSTL